MSESFAELLDQNLDNIGLSQGSLVQGEVLEIGENYVLVDAGLKSEAYIPIEQFKDANGELTIDIGQTIDVALDALEDGTGDTRLSRERAKRLVVWANLETAHREQTAVTGIVQGKVKGGFTVDVDGIRAFLPGSLVDVRPLRENADLDFTTAEFKVIKIDPKRNNIVISRRAVIESENSVGRQELLDSLEQGKVIKGVVKNITDYGAFIDLGGIDGLLHITDMSWKRIRHPSDMIEVGQELEVKVLKFDAESGKVSLGIKQLGEDPWSNLIDQFPEGKRFTGKVTNVADYGCFVELLDGVEGLVHVSEMDWTNRNISPSKIVQVGQDVEVVVLDIDPDRRRISLGIKQCIDNPWVTFANSHQKGHRMTGVIKSITDFGLFVGLEGTIDGLVHMSDLDWDRPAEEVMREYKKGQEVEVMVLTVDPERERISLGIKQLADDPFNTFCETRERGAQVKGIVKEVDQRMVTLELEGGVEGKMRVADLSVERIEDARTAVKEGDEITAQVTNIDRKTRQISLSVRALTQAEEKESAAEYRKSNQESEVKTTLGDLLRDQLEDDNKE